MQQYTSTSPFDSERCPVTGLEIENRPGWADLELGPRYRVSFCIIGERILASAPRGNSGKTGIPRLFEERERVLREAGLWDRPYFEIKDYSGIDPDHPREGRSQFSNALVAEGRRGMLRGYWGYNGPPAYRWIMRLGRLLTNYRGEAPVSFVRDYRAAMLAALAAQGRLELRTDPDRPSWETNLGDQRCRFEIVERDVLFAELPGNLPPEHADRFFALYDRVLSQPGYFPDGSHRLIVQLMGYEPGNWRGRRAYLSGMNRFRRRHPCDHVVVLGSTPLLRAVLAANRHLIHYQIEPARDMDEAMVLIDRRRRQRPWIAVGLDRLRRLRRRPRARTWTQEELDRHTNEILQLLGSINWAIENTDPVRHDVDHDNPLRILVQAIMVLKQDFDAVLRDRAEMKAQVVRAAKLASLGTLTAGLAHELNNPLTAVIGFAQRLERAEDPKVHESAAAVVRAARRMKVIVDKLLQADRPPAVVELDRVDINGPVREALVLFEEQLRQRSISVDLKLADALPTVRANAEHLEGVLHNLLANARDALEETAVDGGRARRITITTQREGRWIKLRFADNGCGMPPEVRERAFDPFYTTKEVGKGAGLGLYVSHKIVDQYDGSITLESEEGTGTTVEILLPVGDQHD
jgi:signal transduction histidine kinase